jgi:hypothetical protein
MPTLKLTQEPGLSEAEAKVFEDVIQTSSEQKETARQGLMRMIARYDGTGVYEDDCSL